MRKRRTNVLNKSFISIDPECVDYCLNSVCMLVISRTATQAESDWMTPMCRKTVKVLYLFLFNKAFYI